MNPLNTITGTLVAGLVMALAIAGLTDLGDGFNFNAFVIWAHVAAGFTWVCLLY